jgi:phosphate transport system permease protein
MEDKGYFRTKKKFSRRNIKEKIIENSLMMAAISSIFVTAGIVFVLIYESFEFFRAVSIIEFLTGTRWTPLFADPSYGILPLVTGTVLIAAIGLAIALPIGLITAIYLSEYATYEVRETVKPILELLESVPGVALGYFALLFLTPILREFIPGLPGFNALSAGLIVGVMISPYISSVSEDAIRAVPMHIREGSYAMGATKLQTAIMVLIPAAFSGIAAAFVMGISRALGETTVVAIAAGMMPNLTLNPLETTQTLTSYIVQVGFGDLPHGTLEYRTIFAAGIVLFIMTLCFNILSFWLKQRIREAY